MIDILLSGQLLVAAILTGTTYAVVGLGLNLVYGTMRLLNVAHGDVAMLGAYMTYLGFAVLGITPLVGCLLAGLASAALGAGLYFGLLQRFVSSRRAQSAWRQIRC